MRKAQTFAAMLLVAGGVVTMPGSALACSCARNPTAERILDRAALVFTAVARQSVPAAPGRSVTTFEIVESFKGAPAGTVVRVLHRSGSSASCGVKFTPGRRYTLSASRIEAAPGLSASLCSTWMFSPRVGLADGLIERMRALRDKRP